MAMTAPASAIPAFARLWSELEEANPDAVACHFPVSSHAGAAEAFPALGNSLRNELKRLKFVFTEAEAQRRFAECAQDKHLAEEPPSADCRGGSIDTSRKDAKETNRALKQRIVREMQIHNQLLSDVKEAYRQARQFHEQCAQELQEAEDAGLDPDAGLDLDLGGEEAAEEIRQASAQAFRGAEEARRYWMSREEGCSKKRRLEAQLRSLESQKRANQARAGAFAKEEARERALADSLEKLQEAEAQLGLPRLELDQTRGVVLMGEPPVAGEMGTETEALRTIQIEFAEDGKLLRAEPHPVLGLERAATKAVQQDDLGALLTMAWGRLCDAAAAPGSEDLDDRLRRLSGAWPAQAGA